MSIKILGGFAKGLSLKVPKSTNIRPTSVMLKRRVFDANQDLSGYIFVDLCAGSGAVGLEALSRGAKNVIFVEFDKLFFKNLMKNIGLFLTRFKGLDKQVVSVNQRVENWLTQFKKKLIYKEKPLDDKYIFFLDPPYELVDIYEYITIFLRHIKDEHIKGQFWIESDIQKGLDLDYWNQVPVDIKKIFRQGTSYIIVVDL